jgi:tetratricopeptide (TPR) repeat protein
MSVAPTVRDVRSRRLYHIRSSANFTTLLEGANVRVGDDRFHILISMNAISRWLLGLACALGLAGAATMVRGKDGSVCFASKAGFEDRIAACTQLIEAPNESNQARTDAHLARARLFYSERKYDEAITDFELAIRYDSHNVQAFYGRALAYLRRLDCVKAIPDFSEAIKLRPDFAAAYNNRGT